MCRSGVCASSHAGDCILPGHPKASLLTHTVAPEQWFWASCGTGPAGTAVQLQGWEDKRPREVFSALPRSGAPGSLCGSAVTALTQWALVFPGPMPPSPVWARLLEVRLRPSPFPMYPAILQGAPGS